MGICQAKRQGLPRKSAANNEDVEVLDDLLFLLRFLFYGAVLYHSTSRELFSRNKVTVFSKRLENLAGYQGCTRDERDTQYETGGLA